MDVLTEQEVEIGTRAPATRLYRYAAIVVYAAVVGAAIMRHEAWADEAQSWLLARDASLIDLWTHLLRYEGTTGLWQTLLHCLIRIGLPYWGMNAFSGLLGVAAVGILLWRAPFPAAIRLALPFTFFLCYQYSVIARSYSLLPFLVFCCAALYSRAGERPMLFCTMLCLMAAVSIHGMALALAIAISALVSWPERKRLARYLGGSAAVVVFMAVLVRPVKDGAFVDRLNFSFGHFWQVTWAAFETALAGQWLSLVVIGMSLPFLWRTAGGVFFLLASILLCVISAVVYSQVWHAGILFLAWLFAMWISWQESDRRTKQASYQLAIGALAIVIAVQCYWTVCSISYDVAHAYSGSMAAARAMDDLVARRNKIYAIGYACVAIEPHFPRNIFANVNDGRPEAYWDWSRRNHVNEDSTRLADVQPDYVIAGYKNEFERGLWTDLIRKSGYRAVSHFEGNTYWQTRIFEPESYDLYRRSGGP